MSTREVISQTVDNVVAIYKDIGGIVRIIEESRKSAGFIPHAGSVITWETTDTWQYPDNWLRRWFARAYYQGSKPKKMVGFCIYLGGYGSQEWRENLEKSNLKLPIMSVSLISTDGDLSTISTNSLYNILWGAGWSPETRQKIEGAKLEYWEVITGKLTLKGITFFLDILTLNDNDTVKKLVVEPMIKMCGGQEDWILKQDFPALPLLLAQDGE